ASHCAPITPGASVWKKCSAWRYALAPFRPCPFALDFASAGAASPSRCGGDSGSPLPEAPPGESELLVALVPDPDDELPVDSSASLDASTSGPGSGPLAPAAAAVAAILAMMRARLRSSLFSAR